MDYTKLNAEFVEKFGELEKLCSDIYGQKHGVSCYIDDMMSKNGERVVLNWDYYLKRLKDVRYKRNKITHGEISFLFAGDAEREAEQAILEGGYDLSSTVLKVGHHGSESSTTYPFLREILPAAAIISVRAQRRTISGTP